MRGPGFFEIYPSARPKLPAGAYVLDTDHELAVQPPDGPEVDVDVAGNDVSFKILAPRYTLPPDQLLSTFPPAGAVGDWSQRLPQVVCKRRTLPWERNPGTGPASNFAPPWLALVVLAEGEGVVSGEVPVAECVTPGVTLAGDGDTDTGRYLEVRQSALDALFPTVNDLLKLAHVRKVDLEDTELAMGDDDGYMAVIMANRLPQPGPPLEPGGPPTSRRYTAFLINVEDQVDVLPMEDITNVEPDFDPFLLAELLGPILFTAAPDAPADDVVMKPQAVAGREEFNEARYQRGYGARRRGVGSEASWATGPASAGVETPSAVDEAKKWLTGEPMSANAELADQLEWHVLEERYRFPVLLSWDFVCTGDGTFESLMNELDTGMLGTVTDETGPEVAATGHIALDHTTRRGDPAVAWYRGPLVPMPTDRTEVPPGQALPLAHSADELRPVVPDGREDLGLGAGFEIGRLLALSKPGIVAEMMAWREELFGAARAATLADKLSGLAEAGKSITEGGRGLEGLLANKLILPYAEMAPGRMGPEADEVAVSRPPKAVLDVVPEEVLTGLGLSVDEVDSAVQQFGLHGLASLAPNTNLEEAPRVSSDPALTGQLRSTLEARVAARAADALKTSQLGLERQPGAAPGTAADLEVEEAELEAELDVLDEILDGDIDFEEGPES